MNQQAYVVQPGSAYAMQKSEWSVGLFDCFADVTDCLFATCLPCIFRYVLYKNAGEDCLSCLCGNDFSLRTKIRIERGINVTRKFCYLRDSNYLTVILFNLSFYIKGSNLGDTWAVACCPCCAMVIKIYFIEIRIIKLIT